MDTTDAIVATESEYELLLNDPRRPLSRFVEVSLAYGRMLAEPDPQRAVEVLSLALETLKDPPAPAEAETALELIRVLRPVAGRLGLVAVELDAIGRERHLLELGLVPGRPGEREWLSRRAAAVHFQSDDAAAGFAELMVGLRGCGGPGLDDLATDLVLAVRRHRVPPGLMAELESMWVELRRQRFDGNWPLWCLTALGALRLDADDVVTAQMYVRRAESILGHIDRPVAAVLVGGWVALATGDAARAHDRFTFAVNSVTADDRLRLLGAAGLGESLVSLGRVDEARAPLAEAIAYDVGDPFSVGRCHELLAEIAAADGRWAEAYRHLQATRRLEHVGRGDLPAPELVIGASPVPAAVDTERAPHADVPSNEPVPTGTGPAASRPTEVVDLRAGVAPGGDEPSAATVPSNALPSDAPAAQAPVAEDTIVLPAGPDRPPHTGRELASLAPAEMAAALVDDALRFGWLRLLLVPIRDNHLGRAGAAEAVVRLEHPEWGLLEPPAFLGPLEDVALATRLAAWTVLAGCRALAAGIRPAPQRGEVGDATISVVIGLRSGQVTADLPAVVRASLAETGAPADRLTVEIDGATAATATPARIAALNELRSLGVHVGIDGFGGSLRSIDTLLTMPVDVVKLDRSVFGGGELTPTDRRMVESVVALARTFGFSVVATGIEEQAQFDRQLEAGCHGAQGSLIGRPVPVSELVPEVTRVA